MTNPIKEKILEEFNKKFVGKCPSHHDPNTHQNVPMIWGKKMLDIKELESFLSSALDRYAREVIDEILPEEKTERSRPEIYPTTGFEVATYEEKEAFNSCLSEVKRRADELLDKE